MTQPCWWRTQWSKQTFILCHWFANFHCHSIIETNSHKVVQGKRTSCSCKQRFQVKWRLNFIGAGIKAAWTFSVLPSPVTFEGAPPIWLGENAWCLKAAACKTENAFKKVTSVNLQASFRMSLPKTIKEGPRLSSNSFLCVTFWGPICDIVDDAFWHWCHCAQKLVWQWF